MKVAILESKKKLVVKTEEYEKPSKDEVLVRVHSCGICGSDLHEYKIGPFFWLPHREGGHEFGGYIEEVGTEVMDFKIGDKVVFKLSLSCGFCEFCQSGRENLCKENSKNTLMHGGGFAEYCTVHKTQVVKLQDDFDLNKAPIIEPLAVAIHVARKIPNKIGLKIIVIGSGSIAYLLAKYLKYINSMSYVAVVGKHSPIKNFLYDTHGIIDYTETLSFHGLFDYAVDCVGTQQSFDTSYSLIKRGGILITAALYNNSINVNTSDIMFSEKVIRGSFLYTNNDFEEAKMLIENDLFDCSEMITDNLPLDDINEAFLNAICGKEKHMKVVINCK